MAKDAFYFSHDTNAFLDPKIRELVSEFGVMAYGVFWVIIEMLAAQRDYRIRSKGLARALHPILQGREVTFREDECAYYDDLGNGVQAEEAGCLSIPRSKIEAMLQAMEANELLLRDGDFLYSRSLIERMERRREISQARAAAGRKGGVKSGASRGKQNEAKGEALLEANEAGKERKGKERKDLTPPTPSRGLSARDDDSASPISELQEVADGVYLASCETPELETLIGEWAKKLGIPAPKAQNVLDDFSSRKSKSRYEGNRESDLAHLRNWGLERFFETFTKTRKLEADNRNLNLTSTARPTHGPYKPFTSADAPSSKEPPSREHADALLAAVGLAPKMREGTR